MNDSQSSFPQQNHYHTNPLKEDLELKELLKELETPNRIVSKQQFDQWRNSFLERFIEFLDVTSTTKAEQAYWKFSDTMSTFVRVINKLNTFIDNRAITSTYCSVKARQCLQELNQRITIVIDGIDTLIPGTMATEKLLGYTKFHIGAVLVRDGFREYARMSLCADVIEVMTLQQNSVIKYIADKLILLNMNTYLYKMNVFCDVMADLGLLSALIKCRECITADDDEEAVLPASPTRNNHSKKVGSTNNNRNDNSTDTYPTFDLSSSITLLDRSNTILENGNDDDIENENNRSLVLVADPITTMVVATPTYDPETSITISGAMVPYPIVTTPESSLTILDIGPTKQLPNEMQEREPAPYEYVSPKKPKVTTTSSISSDRVPAPYEYVSPKKPKASISTLPKEFQPRESAPYHNVSSSSKSEPIQPPPPPQQLQPPQREPANYSYVAPPKNGTANDEPVRPTASQQNQRESAPYGFVAPQKNGKVNDPVKGPKEAPTVPLSTSSLPNEFQPREPAPYGAASPSESATVKPQQERAPAPYGYVASPKDDPTPARKAQQNIPTATPKTVKEVQNNGDKTVNTPITSEPKPMKDVNATPRKPPLVQRQPSVPKDVSDKVSSTSNQSAEEDKSSQKPSGGGRVRWNPVDYYRGGTNQSKPKLQDTNDVKEPKEKEDNNVAQKNKEEKEVQVEKKGIRSFFQRKPAPSNKSAERQSEPLGKEPIKGKPAEREISPPVDDDDSIQLNEDSDHDDDDDDDDKVDTVAPRRRPKWSLNDFYNNTKNRLRNKKEKDTQKENSMKDVSSQETETASTVSPTSKNSTNNESAANIYNSTAPEPPSNRKVYSNSNASVDELSEDNASESSTMVSDNDEPTIRQAKKIAPPTKSTSKKNSNNAKADTKKSEGKQPDKSLCDTKESKKLLSKQPEKVKAASEDKKEKVKHPETKKESQQPDHYNTKKPDKKETLSESKKEEIEAVSANKKVKPKHPETTKKDSQQTETSQSDKKKQQSPLKELDKTEPLTKKSGKPKKEKKNLEEIPKQDKTQTQQKPKVSIENKPANQLNNREPEKQLLKSNNVDTKKSLQKNDPKKETHLSGAREEKVDTSKQPEGTFCEKSLNDEPNDEPKKNKSKSNSKSNAPSNAASQEEEKRAPQANNKNPTKKTSNTTKQVKPQQSQIGTGLSNSDDNNETTKAKESLKKAPKKSRTNKKVLSKKKIEHESVPTETHSKPAKKSAMASAPDDQVWDGRAVDKKKNGNGNEPLAICAAPPEDEENRSGAGSGGDLLMICAADPEDDDDDRTNGNGGELLMICAAEPEEDEIQSNDADGELLMICAAESDEDEEEENDENSLSQDDVSESETMASDDEADINQNDELLSDDTSEPVSTQATNLQNDDDVLKSETEAPPNEVSNQSIATKIDFEKSDIPTSQAMVSPEADTESKRIPPAEKKLKVLTEEERRKCYMWYDRMGRPTRDRMKQRVLTMADCDITVEDVEALPWMMRGTMISQTELNKLIITK